MGESGSRSAKFNLPDRQLALQVVLPEYQRNDIRVLNDLSVRSTAQRNNDDHVCHDCRHDPAGTDFGFRAPMAIAVIGGLISSTILSLLFVPVIYTFIDDLKKVLLPRLAKLTSVTKADWDVKEW